MRRFNGPWAIAGIAGLAIWLFALASALQAMPEQSFWGVLALVTLASLAFVVLVAQVWSRIEHAYTQWTASWLREREPSVHFLSRVPDTLQWGPKQLSPRNLITQIEGHPLHHRLGAAARALLCAGQHMSRDGLDVVARGESFQAVIIQLQNSRWLIIVRDLSRIGETASATAPGALTVKQPAVLAATARYCRGTWNWQAEIEELHALDPGYVAGCGVAAWHRVAKECDLAAACEVTARLGHDGVTWEVDVATTESVPDCHLKRLRELLGELRVPVEVSLLGPVQDGDRDGTNRHYA